MQKPEPCAPSAETLIPSDALMDERPRHARVAAGGTESGYRCVPLRADGSRVEVVMSMSPIRDAGDSVVGVASISRVVSEKERSDSRFASLLAAAPDAILCVDTRGRTHAGLGGLGFELARAHHPDLILLDLHLPGRPGLDVLLALRSDPATSDIPTAILSADANVHQAQRLIAAGAAAYLTKPLDFYQVLHLLDEVYAGEAPADG